MNQRADLRRSLFCVVFLSAFFVIFAFSLLAGCGGGGKGSGSGGPGDPTSNPSTDPSSQPSPTMPIMYVPIPSYSFCIYGNVYEDDGRTLVPVSGAEVRIRGIDMVTYTDSAGYFVIRNLSQGTYEVYVMKPSYGLITRACVVTSGAATPITPQRYVILAPGATPQIACIYPEVCYAGNPVKLVGVNFQSGGTASVKWGNTTVTNLWKNDNVEIIGILSGNPGTDNVYVVTGGAQTEPRQLTLHEKGSVTISSIMAPAETTGNFQVSLNEDLINFNGLAMIFKWDPTKMSLNTAYGRNGITMDPALSDSVVISKLKENAGHLEVGFTLKGNVVSGRRPLFLVSFKSKPLPDGAFCNLEIDSTVKKPKACTKPGEAPTFQEFPHYSPGHLVIGGAQ